MATQGEQRPRGAAPVPQQEGVVAAEHGERVLPGVRDAAGRDRRAELVGEARDHAAAEREGETRIRRGRLCDEGGEGAERIGRCGVDAQLRSRAAGEQHRRPLGIGHLEVEGARLAGQAGEDVEWIALERQGKRLRNGHGSPATSPFPQVKATGIATAVPQLGGCGGSSRPRPAPRPRPIGRPTALVREPLRRRKRGRKGRLLAGSRRRSSRHRVRPSRR